MGSSRNHLCLATIGATETIKLRYGSGTSRFDLGFEKILVSSDSCSASYDYGHLVEERWAGQGPGGEDIIRLGAPGEAWRLLRGASPRRERPNQPPVSSVADTKEDVTKDRGNPLQWVAGSVRNREWPNDVSEAYTENPVGRRGDCAPQSNSASSHTEAGGDGVTNPEANTKGSLWVRSWRACRGQRAWHAGRETPGTWETPSSPSRG